MKKLLALLMVVVLCISLSACGSTGSTQRALTDEELKYVGTWNAVYNDKFLTLRLYDDGVAMYDSSDIDKNVMGYGEYGTWEIRENHVIYYYNTMGTSSYIAYEIDGELLKRPDGTTFMK